MTDDSIDRMLRDAAYYKEWFAKALSDEAHEKRMAWFDRVRQYESAKQCAQAKELTNYPSLKD